MKATVYLTFCFDYEVEVDDEIFENDTRDAWNEAENLAFEKFEEQHPHLFDGEYQECEVEWDEEASRHFP